ncbi:hypothetical protein HDV02_003755 [Globomyces sp. JEL0801]|nr:hypothetical protein HDV02_003755 [Globomyces sp. JEL0801]
MNVQQVYESLAFTVQADAELRKRAEALLLQAQIAPASKDSKPEIAQAGIIDLIHSYLAAVYFKNRIKEGWSASQTPLQPDEKTWLKQHILQGIAQAQPNNKTLLLASISIMISNEHSTGTWPELMPSVVQLVNSQDPNLMNTGLCVLLEWTKNYQMQVSKREPLNIMVQNLFPNLLTIANKLEPMFNHLDALFMLKTILKIYSCSIRMELSNALQSPDSLIPWGTLFLAVVSRQVPDGTFNFPNDADERAKHIWWKCKKWAYSCLNNLMGRYGRGGKTNKRYAGFSKLFLNQFAPKIFEVFYQQLELTMTGVWMSPRVTQLSLTFLEHCIKPKSTWGLFQARLDTIIANFIFPQLCFSESDLELWNEDPVEYIHKKIDPTIDDFRSPVTAATELLGTLVRGRFKVAFVPIVTIINNILTTYNPRQKYGALTMMGCISEMALSEQSPIGSQMESFLVTHVFPDLNSNETYLRAKACDIINSYSNVTFSQQSNLEFVFQTILQRLSDEELPVRVSASLTLAPLLKYPQVKEAIKPHVVQVMQGLLNTTNEIDLDTLTHTMEILVFEFSEELKPFAIQLATQLRDTFMRIMSEANFTSDEFNIDEVEDKTMAAMGVLKTISSLILSVETSLEILLGIEEVVVPALLFILDNSILGLGSHD